MRATLCRSGLGGPTAAGRIQPAASARAFIAALAVIAALVSTSAQAAQPATGGVKNAYLASVATTTSGLAKLKTPCSGCVLQSYKHFYSPAWRRGYLHDHRLGPKHNIFGYVSFRYSWYVSLWNTTGGDFIAYQGYTLVNYKGIKHGFGKTLVSFRPETEIDSYIDSTDCTSGPAITSGGAGVSFSYSFDCSGTSSVLKQDTITSSRDSNSSENIGQPALDKVQLANDDSTYLRASASVRMKGPDGKVFHTYTHLSPTCTLSWTEKRHHC
jgi:hypothetical protein